MSNVTFERKKLNLHSKIYIKAWKWAVSFFLDLKVDPTIHIQIDFWSIYDFQLSVDLLNQNRKKGSSRSQLVSLVVIEIWREKIEQLQNLDR